MKRKISIILSLLSVFVLCFALAACNGNKGDKTIKNLSGDCGFTAEGEFAEGSTLVVEPLREAMDEQKALIAAKELKISDKLLLSDGSCGIIESIQVEHLEQPEVTYNFEVEDFHTYYVADAEILVHNSCAPETKFSKDQKALVELIKENGKNQALSMGNANTLVKWGIEYNVNTRIDMGHSIGTAVSRAPHFHTGFNNWHIPIIK